MAMSKNEGGRPTVMTPERLALLKEAFLLDCTDAEACAYAEIAPATLYDYQTKNPKYSEQKAQWKLNPFLKIRKSVIKAAQMDGNIGIKYLERKLKNEFSTRSELTGAEGQALTVTIKDYAFGGELEQDNPQAEAVMPDAHQ